MTASNRLSAITAELHAIQRRGVEDMLRSGALLVEAKTTHSLAGTSFTRWLKSEFGWSERTAQRWMRAAKWYYNLVDKNRHNVASGLTPTAIIELAAVAEHPEKACVIEVVIRAAGSRKIGATEALGIARGLRDETGKPNPGYQRYLDGAGAEKPVDDGAPDTTQAAVKPADTRPLEVTAEILPPESEEPEEPPSPVQALVREIIELGADVSLVGLDAGEVAHAMAILDQIHGRLIGAAERGRVKAIADRAEARSKKASEPDYLSIPGFLKRPATEQSESGAP